MCTMRLKKSGLPLQQSDGISDSEHGRLQEFSDKTPYFSEMVHRKSF